MKKLSLLAVALLLSISSFAKVQLPALMSDGMVLQRNTEARIWGSTDNGKAVTVVTSWDGKKYKVTPDKDGAWEVKVTTIEAGGPYTVTIQDKDSNVEIKDVLLGEVWLCSGQSNMQMPLMGYQSQPVEGSFDEIMQAGAHSGVRLFIVDRTAPVPDTPRTDVNARWQHSSAKSAAAFSAIGYMFAARLSDNLGIPVGMIESDWGATRIEAWMQRDKVAAIDPTINDEGAWASNVIQSMYDTMIMPCSKYTLKGWLWYQGESNKDNPETYAKLMPEMLREWRELWGGGEAMPFYYVMIAPYLYDNKYDNPKYEAAGITCPRLWEAQMKALQNMANADMAFTTDLGDAAFIHPARKREVADRLVYLALNRTYLEPVAGEQADLNGPVAKNITFNEDGTVVVDFESVSTLCPSNPFEEQEVTGFYLAGEDRVFHKASAHMVLKSIYGFSKSVEVSCPEVPKPVAVRYAFTNVPECNLTNSLGFPAYPFRSDDWNDVE